MEAIEITIKIPADKANELEGLVNRLTLLAEKLSGKRGDKKASLKPGKKKGIQDMNSRERKNHFKELYP